MRPWRGRPRAGGPTGFLRGRAAGNGKVTGPKHEASADLAVGRCPGSGWLWWITPTGMERRRAWRCGFPWSQSGQVLVSVLTVRRNAVIATLTETLRVGKSAVVG